MTTTLRKDNDRVIMMVSQSSSSEDVLPASLCETEEEADSSASDSFVIAEDYYFADVGFMFDSLHKTRLETIHICRQQESSSKSDGRTRNKKREDVKVLVHVVADETPGALQSGHYLWPGAKLLATYLANAPFSSSSSSSSLPSKQEDDAVEQHQPQQQPRQHHPPKSIVELGAGCALVSLTALQVWQESLQVLIVTDHDPGTLVRARDNLETTIQSVLDETFCGSDQDPRAQPQRHDSDNDADTDERLNDTINSLASIPVYFEPLEWGSGSIKEIQCLLQEHSGSNSSNYSGRQRRHVDLVLGSDLLYCITAVEPLLQTASKLIATSGRFWLAQSFGNEDAALDEEIIRVCKELDLKRKVLYDHHQDAGDGEERTGRILEFSHRLP